MSTKLTFKKATRAEAKARLLICGPAGAGKTMTALRVAMGLVRNSSNKRILVLDTERGSANLYADFADFDHADLPDYDWETYIGAINQAAEAGYAVLVIDSISHAWEALLERKDKMQGNSYANWAKVTPMYTRLVQAILNYPGHIVLTCRAKIKYETDERGKPTPIGLDPIMRDGFEYEVQLYGMIDIEHNMTIRKTRIEQFADKIIFKPDEKFGEEIASWLSSGKKLVEIPVEFTEYAIKTEASKFFGKSLKDIPPSAFAPMLANLDKFNDSDRAALTSVVIN